MPRIAVGELGTELLIAVRHKGLANGIDMAIEFQQTQGGLVVVGCVFGNTRRPPGVSLIANSRYSCARSVYILLL